MTSKEVRIPLSTIDSILFQLSQRPDIERSKAELTKIHKLVLMIFRIVKKVNKNDIMEIRALKKQMCILTKHIRFYSKLSFTEYPNFDLHILSIIKQLDKWIYDNKKHISSNVLILKHSTH